MEKRNYNIDLFRIIAAFLVTVLHVLGKGGILKSTSPNEINYWIAWFLEIGAYCAVNCFALITGYVMYNKTIKAKSIIGLWFQVLFYSLLFTSLFFCIFTRNQNHRKFGCSGYAGIKKAMVVCIFIFCVMGFYSVFK